MGNKRVPEVRFDGFSGNWKERKLSNLLDFSNGINAPKESYGKGRKMISVMDVLDENPITYKSIRNSVEVNKESEDKNRVEKGDLIFVRSSEVVEEVGWTKAYLEDEYALYSGFTIRGKKKSEYDARFIELNLNSSSRRQIERKAGGSTRYNVSQSILNSIVISQPHIEEQIKLGDLFEHLDDKIAIHQQELDTLEQTKQGFLQKMFPKKGKSVPEIRFPGFTGDWERRRLSDFAEKSVDNRGKTPPLDSNGSHPLIEVKSLGTGSPNYSKVEKYLNDYSFKSHLRGYIKKGDILFSTVGSIGLVSLMDETESAAIAQNIVAFRAKENYLPEFLYALFSTESSKSKAYRIVMGAVQPSIKVSQLVDVEYFVTNNREEQELIGDFFLHLDKLISHNEQELETLKQTKKAFLQKMFV